MSDDEKIDVINGLLALCGSWPALSDAYQHTEGWKRYDRWSQRNAVKARADDDVWYRDWRIRFYDWVVAGESDAMGT